MKPLNPLIYASKSKEKRREAAQPYTRTPPGSPRPVLFRIRTSEEGIAPDQFSVQSPPESILSTLSTTMVGPAESSTTAQTAVFTPEQQATISAVIQAAITQALATQAAQTAQTVTPAVTVATNSTKDLDLGKPFTFTGKAHDLEKFLQDCALHFTIKRSVYDTDERKAGFMLSHMAGDAARWKEQYMQS